MLDDYILMWHQRYNSWIPITVTIDILKGLKENEIKPVDLTPKLLECNGFKKQALIPGIKGVDGWVSYDRRVILRNDPEYINSENTWSIHVDSEDMASICNAELSYFHQLQHIYKHCEIEKEFIIQ
jgi:hypothetical protein